MPQFDLTQAQSMWDGIFPAIFGPVKIKPSEKIAAVTSH